MTINKISMVTAIAFVSVLFFGLLPLSQDVFAQNLMGMTLGYPFQLQINQSALLQSKDIRIQFLNVTEDSRCPSGVTCIWQGQVKASIGISKGSQSIGNFTLGLTPDKTMALKSFDNYFVQLIDIKPYPVSTNKTLTSDYVATLTLFTSTPLNLFKAGIPANDITCPTGFQHFLKVEDGSPACLKQATANILISRGWTK